MGSTFRQSFRVSLDKAQLRIRIGNHSDRWNYLMRVFSILRPAVRRIGDFPEFIQNYRYELCPIFRRGVRAGASCHLRRADLVSLCESEARDMKERNNCQPGS